MKRVEFQHTNDRPNRDDIYVHKITLAFDNIKSDNWNGKFYQSSKTDGRHTLGIKCIGVFFTGLGTEWVQAQLGVL